ncbi:MAG: Hsp20/alpha crystallin family protein [Deltaproteobacteria bacterium]|nr:Hsp20/alpha crystallin family protein [Deltaproteobacteria bacterium]
MEWKKIAPWNWFKEEETPIPSPVPAASSSPFPALRTEMDRLFEEAFRRFPAGDVAGFLKPSVDISESKKAYTVRAELPGIERDNVSIDVADHRLVIRAEKRQEKEADDEGWHCVERSYGTVQRMLSLPDDADADSIEARFKSGVLTLRIPKQAVRAPGGRRIEIQGG